MTSVVSFKEEGNLDTDTHRGKGTMLRWRQKLKRCSHKTRNCQGLPAITRSQDEAKQRFFLRAFGGFPALPAPRFQTSSVQNGERIDAFKATQFVIMCYYCSPRKLIHVPTSEPGDIVSLL